MSIARGGGNPQNAGGQQLADGEAARPAPLAAGTVEVLEQEGRADLDGCGEEQRTAGSQQAISLAQKGKHLFVGEMLHGFQHRDHIERGQGGHRLKAGMDRQAIGGALLHEGLIADRLQASRAGEAGEKLTGTTAVVEHAPQPVRVASRWRARARRL